MGAKLSYPFPSLWNSFDLRGKEADAVEAQEAKAKIQNWLLEEGFSIQEVPNQDAVFKFNVTDSEGRTVTVGQGSDKKDEVSIMVAIDASGSGSRINAMAAEKRDVVLWDLRFCLLNAGVAFKGVGSPLEMVELYTAIYYDGLTKDRFLFRLFSLRRALALVLAVIGRALQEPPPRIGFR